MNETLDRTKLAKVLEMLRSPHDGERLSAVARANEMLERAGLTWTQFCAGEHRDEPRPGAASAPWTSATAGPWGSPFANDFAGYGAGFARAHRRKADEAQRDAAKKASKSRKDAPDPVHYSALSRLIFSHVQFHAMPGSVKRLIAKMMLATTTEISPEDAKVLDFIAETLGILPGKEGK